VASASAAAAAGATAAAPSRRREVAVVAGLLALAALLRIVRWERTDVLFNDGPLFIAIARYMAAGDWSGALAHPYHPLYPFLTLLAHFATAGGVGSFAEAAVAVSIAGGVAAVLFLYLLVREGFGWPAAPIAAALLAMHYRAVEMSSDVQSEGLYIGLFLGALMFGFWALRRRSVPLAAWAGAFAGLAYLTRPEGLGAGLVACAAALVLLLLRRWSFGRTVAFGSAVLAGAALFVVPYVTVLRVQSGSWSLTHKKSVAVIAGLEAGAPPPPAAERPPTPAPPPASPRALPLASGATPSSHGYGPLRAAWQLVNTTYETGRIELSLLLLLGLVSVRGRPEDRGIFFLALAGLYALVFYGLAAHSGYLSRRHVLPVLAGLCGYGALGVPILGRGLLAAWHRVARRPGEVGQRAAVAVGLLVFAVTTLGVQISPRRQDKLARRLAGEWLRVHAAAPVVVGAPRIQPAYYAGGGYVPVEASAAGLDPATLRARGVTYLILDGDDFDAAGWKTILARPGLRLLHRVGAAGQEALVVAVEPAAGSAPQASGP
jgi:hypothetical protein